MYRLSSVLVSLLALAAPVISAPTPQQQTYYYVPDTCVNNTQPGSDTVTYTVPYTYNQVLSIIGSFKNLTWSGNPDGTVTLNGTNNKPGTARFYSLQGLFTVETLKSYSRPLFGPYLEVHNTAPVQFGDVYAYLPYDGVGASPTCFGRATTLNYTAHFCSNEATIAGGLLHLLHLQDLVNIGTLLGGRNFTTCEALLWPY